MKFIFSYIPEGTTGKNLMEKRFPSNDFKYIALDSVFCADFEYEICLKTIVDHSVQNPSNINQKCQKSGIENKLLRVWLSDPVAGFVELQKFYRKGDRSTYR